LRHTTLEQHQDLLEPGVSPHYERSRGRGRFKYPYFLTKSAILIL
jgi:hypothetical protein